MATITLTPAYGRDYKSRNAVLIDFYADRDFVFLSFGHRDDGRYVNWEQLPIGTKVQFRFNRLTKTFVHTVTAKPVIA